MKSILVTGATGQIGREVVSPLRGTGFRIRGMSRNPPSANLPAGVEMVRGDLTAPDTRRVPGRHRQRVSCLDGAARAGRGGDRTYAAAVGQPALVTSTVLKVTGVPARSFHDWAVDHAGDFARLSKN